MCMRQPWEEQPLGLSQCFHNHFHLHGCKRPHMVGKARLKQFLGEDGLHGDPAHQLAAGGSWSGIGTVEQGQFGFTIGPELEGSFCHHFKFIRYISGGNNGLAFSSKVRFFAQIAKYLRHKKERYRALLRIIASYRTVSRHIASLRRRAAVSLCYQPKGR